MRLLALLLATGAALAAAERRPRIAVGGIMHESNSFYPAPTRLEDFRVERGPGIAAQYAESASEVAGYFAGAKRFGFDLVPTLHASATPGGPVEAAALDALSGELIGLLKTASRLDGLLLALHGAMVSEKFPHGDAEIVRRVRAAMGPAFPIVVTHDFHANISLEIVEQSTVLLGYKTNPHVDQRERGLKAAEILSRIVRGEVKPVQAIAKPPMLYNIRFQNTNVEPLRPIVEETRRLERDPRILAATVAGGYQYADTPAMGVSAVVVTSGDAALARAEAERLGRMLWETRERLKLELPEAAAAVRQALAADKFPVVLVEMGDNIGGGSAGDATFILSELVRQKAQGWVEVIADAEAVRTAARLGIGGRFEQRVGGKTDRLHGEPVLIRGRVKSLNDGKYIETEVRHGGARYHDQGLAAVIEVEGSTRDLPNLLLLTSRRHAPMSLHQLISCGIYPERQKILVVKAAIAFRAAYEPAAARIIEVDTPGATAVNPARFTYRRVRRPLFGLEP
jgi:microcystin degradation protein MlrC